MIRLKECAKVMLSGTLLAAAGCATPGGSSQLESAVYDTQLRMVRLDKNLGGSIDKLNETAAELSAQVSNSDREMEQLKSMSEENQMRLRRLEESLQQLKDVTYRQSGLTPPRPEATAPVVSIEPPTYSVGPGTSNSSYMEGPINVPSKPEAMVENPAPVAPAPVMPANTEAEAKMAFERAMRVFEDENYNDALRQYDSFLATYPNSSLRGKAIFFQAKSQQKLGMNKEALENFQQFRKVDPANDLVPIAMHNQAVVYSKMGDYDSAKGLLRELIAKYPATPAAVQATEDLRKLESY